MSEHLQAVPKRSTLRRVAKAVVPPIIVTAVRSVQRRSEPSDWEYVGTEWPRSETAGWNDESIVRTQLAKWPDFTLGVVEPNPMRHLPGSGDQPATDDDHRFHNTAMAFAYVLARAARDRQRLTMLDWGGGLGQYAVLARALMPTLTIEYVCRDLPRLTAAGRTLLPDDSYVDSDSELEGRTFDLVLASSSLQYSPDWRATLGQLATATNDFLYLTRVPTVLQAASFVVVQRPHRYGYETEYNGWFLNRQELLETARSANLRLAREFLIMEAHQADRAPEAAESRGYLFEPAREART